MRSPTRSTPASEDNKKNPSSLPKPFVSIAPFRVCLFGEHQDYLHLPVIAFALPLYCRIYVEPLRDSKLLYVSIIPDEHEKVYNLETSPLLHSTDCPYHCCDGTPPVVAMDFVRAALIEAHHRGWTFACGARLRSTRDQDFPTQAGCSTSSAFCVALNQALARLLAPQHNIVSPVSPMDLAQWAHETEVTHFGAPGGTMDHITSACGGLLRIGPAPWQVQPHSTSHTSSQQLGAWVLAYSGQPKDTLGHLWRCKNARMDLFQKIGNNWDCNHLSATLTPDEQLLLDTTRINRDCEEEAASLLFKDQKEDHESSGTNLERLGQLMTLHHQALRDGLQLSTEKLEQMNQTALQAGALGFKVVGSGGGGFGVAWVAHREKAQDVERAFRRIGCAQVWIVDQLSDGAKILEEW